MKYSLVLSFAAFLAGIAQATVRTETITYKEGKTTLQGTLAYDDATQDKRPGVVVYHEWMGNGDYTRRRAEQLAALGYVAFAADIYGKGVMAKDHAEAGKLSGIYRSDRKLMRARARAGLEALKKNKFTDGARTAAIGYCFGGTTALELARDGADILGAASFHGSLETPMTAQPGAIKAKILVLNGSDDKWVMGGVPAFEAEMKQAGADWQMITYGGAVHSFTVPTAGDDPSAGMAYDADADRRSWQALQSFLSEIFGK